jgi:hypothetical protein
MEKLTNDIANINSSCVKDIRELYNKSPYKKWIKLIPTHKTSPYEEYNRKENFIPVADIVLDGELHESGKNEGNKKRNTVIKFVPIISKEKFNEESIEWLYLFVIEGRIIKFGGTRTGLKGRVGSYLCGHHIKARGKSGDCSKTNGFIYNTFEFYLNLGCKIQMYGYELPETIVPITILGKETKIKAQTYHAYETTFMEDYKEQYMNYPILNDNGDPNYKK